jgi:hypothetical protein
MARLSAREILWNKLSRTRFQDRVMPYVSRVYADVKRLQEIGLVNALSLVQAGKRVTLLSAA